MPSEKQPFYDPVPPTYDEALASGSRREDAWAGPSRSPVDDRNADESETQNLLAGSSSRRPQGYRPPTVETDDEDSLWDSDSSSDEAEHVRMEMEEMDMEEPDRSIGSAWRKRLPFRLSLPQWKWSWRPRLPRLRIRLPSRPESSDTEANNGEEGQESTRSGIRLQLPQINSMLVLLTVARLLALVVILGFLFFLFTSGLLTGWNSPMNGGRRFGSEELRNFVQESVDETRLRLSVRFYSNYAHIAGTEGDAAHAMNVQTMFTRAGLEDVERDEYSVYLNFPTKDGRAVQIMDQSGKKAVWTAKLEEEERHQETAGRQTWAFHGLSKSGDVKGPLVYANYGSRADFKKLKDLGVQTKGAIALVRYYGAHLDAASKVKAAELAGFAGCIIYSDPADDGFKKGKVAPDGRYMPPDGVQRASVGLTRWLAGDVLTPGWESKPKLPRMDRNQTQGLVKIPSLPLAWRDAQILLQHLKGHGEKVQKDWVGGVPDVGEWWTGNSSSPIVRLKNEQDEVDQKKIWNVYGRIQGMEQSSKSIIIGNHRDSWAFGATNPHSGTAIMIELARIFGDMANRGWRPLRTIEFMSWDAEEYNLIGSTEYVENNLNNLRENAYAYINLDTVVAGTQFRASGSPVFDKTVRHALNRVSDPNHNKTLGQLWDERRGRLEALGADSDYVAFQDIAGTSSLDVRFTEDPHDPYPLHSSYDNLELVENVIDPGFVYHGMMGQVVGLILLDLADRAIVPMDTVNYANRLGVWVDDLGKWIAEQTKGKKDAQHISLREMRDAVQLIKQNANQFRDWEKQWDASIAASGGWESNDVGIVRVEYNDKLAQFETAFLDTEMGGGVSFDDSSC